MYFKNINSQNLISIAIAGACTVAFGGCQPTIPATSKFALYYQVSDSASGQKMWIKRWLPGTGETNVIYRPDGDSARSTDFITSQQPYGSILTIMRADYPNSSLSALVPDTANPQPTLLWSQIYLDPAHFIGGIWAEWAPDGKHIGLQVDDEIVVASPDGTSKTTVATIDGMQYYGYAAHAWSADSSKIAYTRGDNIIAVVDINTKKTTNFSIPDDGQNLIPDDPVWMADNRHLMITSSGTNESRTLILDLQNPASIQPGFANAGCCLSNLEFSPGRDRAVMWKFQDNTAIDYVLAFADGRTNLTLSTTAYAFGDDSNQLLPSWSHDGGRLAYITDANRDGNAELIIASKDGATLQTFTGFGPVSDATLSWSPDNSKLVVTTNVVEAHGGITNTRLVTLGTSTIDTLIDTAALAEMRMADIEWSPDSRFVVHGYRAHDFRFIDAGALLIDTLNPVAMATPLNANYFEWAFDSSYLGMATNDPATGNCSASAMKMGDGPRAIKQVAPSTTCRMFWSTPGSNSGGSVP